MIVTRINIEEEQERLKTGGLVDQWDLESATIYPELLKAVVDTYKTNGHYLICEQQGRLTGVASFFERKSLKRKRLLISTPGGFWAENIDCERRLMVELERIAAERNLKGPYFQDLYRRLNVGNIGNRTFRAIKALDGNESALLSSFSKNIRRDYKYALKYGLVFEKSEDINSFYSVWSHNMRDLGTPPVAPLFFSNLKKYFGSKAKIFLVKKGGKCIGGAFVIHNGSYAVDPYLSSLRSHFRFFPNVFIYCEMLAWACRNGIKTFDLGRSQPGSGNERFKLRFRAKLLPLYDYPFHNKSGPQEKVHSLLTDAWKHFPVGLSNRVGPLLRTYIPFG